MLTATVVASYAVTQNWGSGFEGQIKLTNQQTIAVPNWTLEFDFGASITSIWDGQIVSHTGTHYVVANAGWNSNLSPADKSRSALLPRPARRRPARRITCSMANRFPAIRSAAVAADD